MTKERQNDPVARMTIRERFIMEAMAALITRQNSNLNTVPELAMKIAEETLKGI